MRLAGDQATLSPERERSWMREGGPGVKKETKAQACTDRAVSPGVPNGGPGDNRGPQQHLVDTA